jgi:hypothetical protein
MIDPCLPELYLTAITLARAAYTSADDHDVLGFAMYLPPFCRGLDAGIEVLRLGERRSFNPEPKIILVDSTI